MFFDPITSEAPQDHWKQFECAGLRVLDLGCASAERGLPATSDYFLSCGAAEVFGVDSRAYNEKRDRLTIARRFIADADDLRDIISEFRPAAIKCDIEGKESALNELDDSMLEGVNLMAVETHSTPLLHQTIRAMKSHGFHINGVRRHSIYPSCRVVFATRL